MHKVGLLSILGLKRTARWQQYVGDSLLAIGCIVLLTAIFSLFHFYQSIPDSVIIYLLVILILAGIRGPYAALFASFVAFFSFDFLFIPPVYGLITTKSEDILALFVFLITSVTAGQLASILRQQAEDARGREREARLLYDLVRATNHEEDREHQLHIFARSVVEVFSGLGVRDCSVLLPDEEGKLLIQASVHQTSISPSEETVAEQVMIHGHMKDMHDQLEASSSFIQPLSPHHTVKKQARRGFLRFIPLKTSQKIVGVLRLHIEENPQRLVGENILGLEQKQPSRQALFFSTFLEQAVTVIEQDRLQHASLQNKVLQQTDSLRAALLSSVSHDLRTPLTSIKTAATSLLQHEVQLDADTHEDFLLTIEREADRLNRLVENLLDMSRIEGGALHPQKVWYPMDELLHGIVRRMRPVLEGREIRVQIPDDLLLVEIDVVQIGQAITNLLENAHRYTATDLPIDIDVQAQMEQIVVHVADRGPGISPAERERIFDKFYRVTREPHTADYKRGSGLGLAVCRGFVEAHDGRIWVEAREGGGAVFSFTLPRGNLDEDSYE